MLLRELTEEVVGFIHRNDSNKSVLIVQGARQVGKTFLVQTALREADRIASSFNLEQDLLLRDEIDSSRDFADFTAVLNKYGFKPTENTVLYIDEAQESRKLGSYVRFMKESWQHATVILSGSSISKLFSHDTRVPVGRVEYLRVTPLTFKEFAWAVGQKELLEEAGGSGWRTTPTVHRQLLSTYDTYLKIGGLPAIVNKFISKSPEQEIGLTRKEIYLSQEDDFYRKETNLKPHLFKAGTEAVADLLGSPFSLTRITPNHRDASATLNILCEWLIAYRCQQRTLNPSSEPRPKVYLYDVGLARQLRESVLPSPSLLETRDSRLRTVLGGLVENAIYIEMQQGKNFLQDISGWRVSSKDSVEVDFVVKCSSTSIPVEVKCSEKIDRRNFSGLHKYMEKTGQRLGVLASTAPYEEVKTAHGTIINLPLYAVSMGGMQALPVRVL